MDTDRRYQVFVSSTYLDLREERSAVVSALLNLDAFPAGMEVFPAADDDAWTLIEDVIADSDYYLLVVGGKYGSIDPDTGISYTEREYDAAVRLKKPVMAFLHGDPGKLLAEQTEASDDGRAKLNAFREKVKREKHVKFWTSPEDLAGKVALTWNAFRRRYPAIGWIRADQGSSQESLAALAKAQDEIGRLKEQLEAVRTEAPPGTESLAQGESKFRLPVQVRGTWRDPKGYPEYRADAWTNVDMTWDRVFGYMGLRMMQEADEATLEEDLCDVAQFDHVDHLVEVFKAETVEEANARKTRAHQTRFEGVEVADEDFQTVLLQFNALGLIQRSMRERSVKDTSNYWTLTPYGHTHLVQLRAIQSGEQSLMRPGDQDVEYARDAAEKDAAV